MIIVEKLSHKRKKPTKNVKLVLLGLTPGKQQHRTINNSRNPRNGSFKGYMRKQIYEWFVDLGIANELKLENEDTLFVEKKFEDLIYISSLLREPVYVKKNGLKKNYTGRSPYPWKNDSLFVLMDDTLKILEKIEQPVLIVPMGKIVTEAIIKFSNLDDNNFILHGFPHPSGANGSRKIEFKKNKNILIDIVSSFFKIYDI
jgi:hypothetical protein